MLGFYLLYAMLIFLIGAALVQKPVAAEGGEVPIPSLDGRISFRVSVAAVVLALLLAVGLIAAYVADPQGFKWAVSRPLERLLTNYHWVIVAGVAIYLIARLCGVKHRHSLWLFCLSLPGAVAMPVTVLAALLSGAGDFLSVSFDFLLHPATLGPADHRGPPVVAVAKSERYSPAVGDGANVPHCRCLSLRSPFCNCELSYLKL
jgi:hypothetical protein